MTEGKTPTMILKVPKDKVRFEGELAVIDVGLTVEEFIMSVVEFASGQKKAIAIQIKEGEE